MQNVDLNGPTTVSAGNLNPATGNTTQSLGVSGSPWNAVLNSITTGSLNGAIVVDGVNFTTIQAAINACPTNGGIVYLPPGTYTQNAPLTLRDGIRIIGAGCGAIGRGSGLGVTQINTNLTTGALFPILDFEGIHISDIAVNCTGAGGAIGIQFKYGQYCTIERFAIYGGFTTGIQMNADPPNGSTIFNHIRDGEISLTPSSAVCILIDSGTSTTMVNNSNIFTNVNCAAGSGGFGLSIVGGAGE